MRSRNPFSCPGTQRPTRGFEGGDIQPDQMAMQGFRAMARTILDVVSVFRPFVEYQLAHAVQILTGRQKPEDVPTKSAPDDAGMGRLSDEVRVGCDRSSGVYGRTYNAGKTQDNALLICRDVKIKERIARSSLARRIAQGL